MTVVCIPQAYVIAFKSLLPTFVWPFVVGLRIKHYPLLVTSPVLPVKFDRKPILT